MSNNSPCLNCPDRVIGCHAICEKYGAYPAQNLERQAARYAASKKDIEPSYEKKRNIKRAQKEKR